MNNREAREKRDETAGIQGRRLSSAFDIPSLPWVAILPRGFGEVVYARGSRGCRMSIFECAAQAEQ